MLPCASCLQLLIYTRYQVVNKLCIRCILIVLNFRFIIIIFLTKKKKKIFQTYLHVFSAALFLPGDIQWFHCSQATVYVRYGNNFLRRLGLSARNVIRPSLWGTAQARQLMCSTAAVAVNGYLSGCVVNVRTACKDRLVFILGFKRYLYFRSECFAELFTGGATPRASARVWSGKDDPTRPDPRPVIDPTRSVTFQKLPGPTRGLDHDP